MCTNVILHIYSKRDEILTFYSTWSKLYNYVHIHFSFICQKVVNHDFMKEQTLVGDILKTKCGSFTQRERYKYSNLDCLSQARDWISNIICRGLYLRWEEEKKCLVLCICFRLYIIRVIVMVLNTTLTIPGVPNSVGG
jgi:hypothetical protein